jgi:hypothetical protein
MGGAQKGSSVPLERQKTDIIDVLDRMHSNMREYSMDFEDKLEKVHASLGGQGGKKFGFENM